MVGYLRILPEKVRGGVMRAVCILWRSQQRRSKEHGISQHFEKEMAQRLRKMESYCEGPNYRPEVIGERLGRLKHKCIRAPGLFEIEITQKPRGRTRLRRYGK